MDTVVAFRIVELAVFMCRAKSLQKREEMHRHVQIARLVLLSERRIVGAGTRTSASNFGKC